MGPPTRRAVVAGVAALAAGAPLAGCARARDGGDVDGSLRFWAMGYEGDYSPILMPAFTRATGVRVEVQSLPWTAAHEKLLTAHAGGALPDVMMLPNGWVGEFAMIGALAPPADPALFASMFPGVADTVAYAGRPHAVPWSVAPQMQFYRRDLLAMADHDEPPGDWDAWRAAGLKLKRRRPDDYYVLLYLNWWDGLFSFAGQAGARLLRDRDTHGNFRSPEFARALEFYKSLFDLGLAPRAMSTQIEDPVAAFARGMFAIYPRGPSLLVDLLDLLNLRGPARRIARDRWSVARLPGPDGPGATTGVSGALAVSAASRRADDAWALVRHLTSVPSELRFQPLIGNLPARADAWPAMRLEPDLLRPFAEQLADPAPSPNIPEWERIRTEVTLSAERVVRGLMTLKEGLADMDRRADAVLARRRALVDAGKIA